MYLSQAADTITSVVPFGSLEAKTVYSVVNKGDMAGRGWVPFKYCGRKGGLKNSFLLVVYDKKCHLHP